jgi:glycosyltransferase involved in cell wall biosynthesis
MLCDYPDNPSEIYGGTSSAAYHLVKALIRYVDVDITTFSFWPDSKVKEYRTNENGVRLFRYPRQFKLRWLINYADQRLQFRRFLKDERPDLVHAQGEGLYASLAVNSALPNIFTIHGVRLKELEMSRKRIGPLRYHLMKRLITKNHEKAKNIIAINEYTKQQISHLNNANVRIIRNAVDETFFELYKNETPQIGHILMVGGLKRRKNNIAALKAVNQIIKNNIPAKVNIVGPIESDYLTEVNNFIDKNEMAANVSIYGLVSSKKLRELYLNCDLFLLSSVEESSPISIVEAMAAGKPIVTTDVGGISEMIAENENGYMVSVDDIQQMTESIIGIINNRTRRDKFGKNSHEIALESWSSKAVALNTYKTYLEVLNER